jgi:AcrR family transcriptional regulator
VHLEPIAEPRSQDRRVLRSRASLLTTAVRLVSELGTTDIPVTELADAANVSRQLVYLQFGDRDALLVEAAVDLVRRELVHEEGGSEGQRPRAVATTRHFARYRPFYRAMLTGSCAFAMTRTLSTAFSSFTQESARELFGDLDRKTMRDMTAFVAGGVGAIINNWLIDGEDPLRPDDLAERLLRLGSVLAGRRRARAARNRRRSNPVANGEAARRAARRRG